MGMFDSVSNAASAVGAPLSTASNLLGGNMGDGATNDAVKGKPTFWRGYNLDVDQTAEESAGQAPNLANALNSYPVIEFIHFGWVHTSHSNFFTHDDLSGTKKDASGNAKIKDSDRPRGIQFRSALEREALLLWLFMLSTQEVLKKKEDDSKMGGVGAVLDVASSMFGGNKPGGGQTQSSELTGYMQKVTAAISPILNDSIVYKDVHKAGVDLHQARADYRALLDKIIAEKPSGGDGGIAGTLMNQATALPGNLTKNPADVSPTGDKNSVAGTLSGIVSMTQGIVFKVQDIVAKIYAQTAKQQEPQVEDACNEMSYQGIHQTMNPFFPIWFTPGAPAPTSPDDQWGGPKDPLAGKNLGTVGNTVMGVMQGVDDGLRQGFAQSVNNVKGIFEKPPDGPPPPGTEPLGMAFNDPPRHKGDKSLIPMKMGDVAYQAFTNVLGVPSLGFVETIVSGVMGVVLEFTLKLYQAMLLRDSSESITNTALVASAAGDLKLASRLEAIAREKLSFINTIRDFDIAKYTQGNAVFDGLHAKPGAGIMDRGVDFLDGLIASKLTPLLDPIIAKAMDGVAAMLEASRNQGVTDNCHTMEWYLGRLPKVQAMLFGDLFFPFYSKLMTVAAEVIGGPVGSALKSILALADKMKKVEDTARDDVAKAGAYATAADALLQGGGFGDKESEARDRDIQRKFQDAKRAKGDANTVSTKANTPEQQALKNHPLTGRVDMGQGVEIKLADYKEMLNANPKIFKWDDPDTQDPSADRNGAKPPGGSAPGGDGSKPT